MRRVAVVVAAAAVVVGACGGGNKSNKSYDGRGGGQPGTTVAPDRLARQCPLAALASAPKPVRITYWHAMQRANETTLKKLTAQFNAAQSDVRVTLVNQQGYDESFTKYKSAAGTKDAPDLVQIEDTALQQMIDSETVVPAAACVAAGTTDVSDILPRVLAYYTVAGTLYPVPFNVSNPVFYYNKVAFRKAGLDPAQAPATLAEVSTDAQRIKAAGYQYGFYYKRDSWVLEQYLALNGLPYVDNGNGRTGRAGRALFDTPAARAVLTQIAAMVRSGVAASNPSSGPSGFDNLLAICNGKAAMTIDTSAALGTAYDVLGAGQCPSKVEIGVAPLPGATASGGVLVGGAANYIPKGTDPAKIAAAWRFAQFLTTPGAQATWSAGTGYLPISRQAARSSTITKLWAERPGYKVAYDQLVNGPTNEATAGPVIGAYKSVRDEVTKMLEAVLISGAPVDRALAAAVTASDAAIAEYNRAAG